jgi:iron complex outermembrane receptor protein
MNLNIRNVCHTSLALLFAIPGVASAQTSADQPQSGAEAGQQEISDIVVTATRTGETLSRVAAAVTAVRAEDIGPGGVQNIADLAQVVPNISIGDQLGVNRTYIRGVGLNSFSIGGEGAVAFLQNGAILARPAQQLSGFFDLEQIEVLRGPQSILYGRGATAGAINLVTAKPTDELAGFLRGSYGNYNSKILEGAVGGPISGDRLLVRFAGKYEKRDGYGKNQFTGRDVDNRDSYAFRGTVLARLTDTLNATLIVDHFHEDDNNYALHYFGPSVVPDAALPHTLLGGETIIGYYNSIGKKPNLRDIYSDKDATNKRKGWGGTGLLDWDLGDLTIKSTTAYRTFDRFNFADFDLSQVNLAGESIYAETSKAFSQELTLNYRGNGFSLLGGAMYFHEKLDGNVNTSLDNLGLLFGLPADTFNNGIYTQTGTVKIDAYGAYLQAAVDVTPTIKVTAGARYNYERRAGKGFFRFDAIGVNVVTDTSKGWSSITPKLLLEWRPTDATMLYASVTKGFKSGVINVGTAEPAINPETVWSYEAGFKQRFAGGRGRIAGAIFYYDYSNLQVSLINTDNTIQTINAAAARNYGGELEFDWKLSDQLSINADASYLNGKFTKFCNYYYGSGFPTRPGISYPACATNPGLADVSGNRLPNAPRFSFGGGFDYNIPIGEGRVTVSGDVRWQSKVYYSEFNNEDASQNSYALANASLTYHAAGDRWTVGAWVKNLTNKFVIANAVIPAAVYGYGRIGTLLPPRTYGATLGYKF